MHKIKQDQRWVRRRLRSAALTAQEPLPRFQTQTSSCTRTHEMQARPGFEEGSTHAGVAHRILPRGVHGHLLGWLFLGKGSLWTQNEDGPRHWESLGSPGRGRVVCTLRAGAAGHSHDSPGDSSCCVSTASVHREGLGWQEIQQGRAHLTRRRQHTDPTSEKWQVHWRPW